MNVLFVSSGNNKFGIAPVVHAQGVSLKKSGINLEYFTIKGKGVSGYTKNILKLRKHIKSNKYDLIHSHYILSAVVATFSKHPKIIVSLMGSDVFSSKYLNILIKLFHNYKWKATLVKSKEMKEILNLQDLFVIPNGVDLQKFYPMDKNEARTKIGWQGEKYILFSSYPERKEKNYLLAEAAVNNLSSLNVKLVSLMGVRHDEVCLYINAADVLLMTSNYEGSPNIIKEAMACNCPIVSTDVGDVKWIIGETEGCFITASNIENASKKIKEALKFVDNVGKTNGRARITELGLDSITIAKRIIEVYNQVLRAY